jgi:hypothetical protein
VEYFDFETREVWKPRPERMHGWRKHRLSIVLDAKLVFQNLRIPQNK